MANYTGGPGDDSYDVRTASVSDTLDGDGGFDPLSVLYPDGRNPNPPPPGISFILQAGNAYLTSIEGAATQGRIPDFETIVFHGTTNNDRYMLRSGTPDVTIYGIGDRPTSAAAWPTV